MFISDDMMMMEDVTDAAAAAAPDKKLATGTTNAALLSAESIAAIERYSGSLGNISANFLCLINASTLTIRPLQCSTLRTWRWLCCNRN